MIDFIRSWMELGKGWRSKADAPYQVTASVLAVLTIAAIAADKTPAAIVSVLFAATGWRSGSEWLITSAPPFLEFHDQGLSHAAAYAFFFAVGILWVLPVIRNRLDVVDTFYDSARLVWSRAAASCWLILLFAAQTGNVQVFLGRIVSETGTTVASVLGWALGAVAVVWLFGLRFAFLASLGSLLAQVLTAGFNAGANVGLTILAVPVSVPWAVCSWLFTTESQASIEAEEESARIRPENSLVASGAIPITRATAPNFGQR
ncbi:hypothetical protein ACQCSU_21375 [Pseudarthrobacter sp. O4]|uniref:hypothetical protein n=1 Tax=Pseudarthrobacter sp. O4 TaxID=3418417 RepID=UPI003CE82729